MSQVNNSICTPVCHSFSSDNLNKALTEDTAFFTSAHRRRYRVRRAVAEEARLADDASQSPTQAGCGWYVIAETDPQPRRRMIQLGDNFDPENACDNLAQALYDIARVELKAFENGNE